MTMSSVAVDLLTTDTVIFTCPALNYASVHGLVFNVVGANVTQYVTVKLYKAATGVTHTMSYQLPISAPSTTPDYGQRSWPKPINMEAGDILYGAAQTVSRLVALASVYTNEAQVTSAPNPRGAWSSGATYAVNDYVYLAGSSYIAIAANTNSSPPGANWTLFVGPESHSLPFVDYTGAYHPIACTSGRIAFIDYTGASLSIPLV